MNPTLVIQPATNFSQIAQMLSDLDWRRCPDTSIAPPLVPGEPEFASWSRRDDDGRISYTFNPVVRLRVLVFYGESADLAGAEVARVLPTLEISDIRELLQSDDPRKLLLGILAARELRARETIDLIDALRSHPHERVAAAAHEAHFEMLASVVETKVRKLQEEKQQHPELSPLFAHLADAEERRQVMRWLIHDYTESNKHIDAVIRSGLIDDDWEVRATAMLLAVRFDANSVWSELEQTEIVRNDDNVADKDRSILHAAHKLAVAHLLNRVEVKDDKKRHLLRCMLGHPVEEHDRVFRLIHALSEPLGSEDENSL